MSMLTLILGNALWQLVQQSDWVSKLVLLILAGMSVLCWAIFFYKLILLRIKKKQLGRAIKSVQEAETLDTILTLVSEQNGTVPGYFLSRNLGFLKSQLERAQAEVNGLSLAQHELVQQHMYQVTDDMVQAEESYLPVLQTCAHVAPLLGLFGTVWGLVHSFIRISQQQSADIATVAPGIAEALITTLAGLMVAIPALIMFNYLTVQVRRVEQQLVRLAERFGFLVQRLFVK